MTDITIQVVALVADPSILTFYKTDGSTYAITQGDPRGLAMSDEFFAQRRLGKEVITLIIGEDNVRATSHLNNAKRNPLIRFFRAPLEAVRKLFGAQVHENKYTAEGHEAAAARVKELAQRLMASGKEDTDGGTDDLPVRMIHSDAPMEAHETIIAVTNDGIIPSVESLNDQFAAADEGKAPAQGVDNLIIRLAKMSAKRGHTATELMKFIEKIDLPPLPDGSFLAYKRLKHIGAGVYTDPHTGRVHQRIGDIVEMDEKLVNTSRRLECSQGLHVGTRHYMGGFHSHGADSGTMLVLIEPEDVIAVPQNEASKMRTCRYRILADLSSKAHDLVNKNKRVDDCKDTMSMIAQIIAGARPPELGRVLITQSSGHGLRYILKGTDRKTNLTLAEAQAIANGIATAPVVPVTPVRTIDETRQGKAEIKVPEKVRDKANIVKPMDVKAKAAQPATACQIEIQRLYTNMTRGVDPIKQQQAAMALRDLKTKAKVSWEKLGLTATTFDEIQKVLSTVQKPSTPQPKAKVAKPAAKVEAKPEPKAEPVKAPEPPKNETRQDKARRLWNLIQNGKDAPTKRVAADLLRNFKKSAKVGWSQLGLGDYNVDAELKKLLS